MTSLKDIIRQEPLTEFNEFNIIFYLIDFCNFSCYYCYNKFPRSKQQLNADDIIKFIKNIQSIITTPIRVTFIGGEPTCHLKLIEIVSYLHSQNIITEILTNFSAKYEDIITLLELNTIIIASWHGGSQKTNLEFSNKLKKIPKKYFDLNLLDVRIMFEPDNWQNSYHMFNELFDFCKKDLEIHLLEQPNGSFYTYSPEQLQEFNNLDSKLNEKKDIFKVTFNDNSQKLVSFNDLYMDQNINFHMWKCDAGKKSLYVHSNGNIYPCQSYYEHMKIPLFNICSKIDDIKNKLKNTICLVDYCSCDFNIKKEKVLLHYH